MLESFGLSGRLARGRSYARAGQVLDFELSQGKVTAQVQGSRPRPYQVRIGVLPLTTAQWRKVFARLASQALFRAKLLAGEMPHEIEDVFAECGTPLFPRTAADLDMHCSCPDWGVPCKHLAAVCYVLAEEFDLDPFAMLAWRGKDRDELLAALRQLQLQLGQASASPARGGPVPGSPALAGPALAGPAEAGRGLLDVPAAPLAGSLDTFWSPGLSPARLRALSAAPGPATRTCCCGCSRRRRSRCGERTWVTCWRRPTAGWPPATPRTRIPHPVSRLRPASRGSGARRGAWPRAGPTSPAGSAGRPCRLPREPATAW